MSTIITLATKNPLAVRDQDPKTLRDLREREFKQYGLALIQGTKMKERADNESSHPSIERYTKKEFNPSHIDLFAKTAEVFDSLYATRSMVRAINRLMNDQTSCPSTLNQNDYCRTSIDGLYKLPEWALPKDLVKRIRGTMQQRAIEYRKMKAEEDKQKKIAAREAAAQKALPAPAEGAKAEGDATPKKKRSGGGKKKASTVEPTSQVPAEETLAPPKEEDVEVKETPEELEQLAEEVTQETEEMKEAEETAETE